MQSQCPKWWLATLVFTEALLQAANNALLVPFDCMKILSARLRRKMAKGHERQC
jgi:hypothetical protein